MTLPVQDETANLSVSNRKKELLNEARAEALRANLRKRKEQSSARKTNNPKEETATL